MGIRLDRLIELPPLRATEVLAGATGLQREIERVTVLESPDIADWISGGELVLTNTFLFQAQPGTDARLIEAVADRGAGALGIKLGRYITSLSAEALRYADEMSFPVLKLPYEMAWADMINVTLTELLNEKSALLERSENIHTQFTTCVLQGRGLDGIASTLNNLTGMPLIITDRNLDTLAAAGPEAATDALIDQTEVLLEMAREDHFLNDLAGPPENGIRRSILGAASYLVVPIRVHGRREGYILLAERTGKPLGRYDIIAVQHARTLASIEFLKRRAVLEVERRFGSDFVLDLISGRFDSMEAIKRRASYFNLNLSTPHALLLAELDEAASHSVRTASTVQTKTEAVEREEAAQVLRDNLLMAVNQYLRRSGKGGAAMPVGNRLIILVPVRPGASREEVKRLAMQTGENLIQTVSSGTEGPKATLSIGVGRFDPAIERLPQAYRQAREALEVGCSIWGRGRVYHFDDLGVLRLLTESDRTEASSFVNDILGPLAEYDERHGSQLLDTLEAFLATNGNLSQAARRLIVHVNTLKYRLRKIQEITGRSFEDADSRMDAQLALRIVRAFPSLLKKAPA